MTENLKVAVTLNDGRTKILYIELAVICGYPEMLGYRVRDWLKEQGFNVPCAECENGPS